MLKESMYLEIDKINGETSVFYLYNSTEEIANTLKTVIMDQVPTMAIDVVNVTENQSLLPDELIVQRLGLIPLESHQVDQYLFPDQCACSGQCSKCSALIHLTVDSSKVNNVKDLRRITSLDLTVSETHQVRPVKHLVLGEEKGVVIIPLKRDQNLRFECYATKGRGCDHTKWSPVCKVVYWTDQKDTSPAPRIYFSVETTGGLTIPELLTSACQIMTEKSIKIILKK